MQLCEHVTKPPNYCSSFNQSQHSFGIRIPCYSVIGQNMSRESEFSLQSQTIVQCNGAKKSKKMSLAYNLKSGKIKVCEFLLKKHHFHRLQFTKKKDFAHWEIPQFVTYLPNVLICVSHPNRNMYSKCVCKVSDHILTYRLTMHTYL